MNQRAALWLGAASAIDYLAQLALPALLVRTLSPAEFGGYRILWMSAQTAVLLLSLNMALNLVYQLPRHPLHERGALLCNVLAWLLGAGLLAAALSHPLMQALGGSGLADVLPPWALPGFVAAWMLSLPFDQVALATGQPRLQARFTLVQTVLRLALLGGAAWWTRSLGGVAAAMIALALLRFTAVAVFAVGSGAFEGLRPDAKLGVAQLRYGLAFGLGASLFALRGQVDGWIAALLFDPVAVATVSIALAIVPIIGVVRQAFSQATISDVARLFALEQPEAALQVNRDANLSTAMLVLPFIGLFIAIAPDLIALVYTPAYVSAAGPARLYALAYAACVLEMSSVVQALGHGRFVMRSGALLLAGGAVAGLAGALAWGLPGLAGGSLLAMWLGAAWNIAHVARRCRRRVATLQPWGEMGLLAALAAAALAASLLALERLPWGDPPSRAVAGGAVFVLAYAALVLLAPSARRLYLARAGLQRDTALASSHS